MTDFVPTRVVVAPWRINLLRLVYALIAFVMGGMIWSQVFGDVTDWPLWKGVGKSMLAALALVSLWGIVQPLKLLPLMVYELAWKTVWLVGFAGRAWAADRVTPEITGMVYDCIGVVVLFVLIPWRYLWHEYFAAPGEPWRAGTMSAMQQP